MKFNIYEVTITPNCVENRGLCGARKEALCLLEKMIEKSQRAYPNSKIVLGYRIED